MSSQPPPGPTNFGLLSYNEGPSEFLRRPRRITVVAAVGILLGLIALGADGALSLLIFRSAFPRLPKAAPPIPAVPVVPPAPVAKPPPRIISGPPAAPYSGEVTGVGGMALADRERILEYLGTLCPWGYQQRRCLSNLLQERGARIFDVPAGGITPELLDEQLRSFSADLTETIGGKTFYVPENGSYQFETPAGRVEIKKSGERGGDYVARFLPAGGSPAVTAKSDWLFTDEQGRTAPSARSVQHLIEVVRNQFGNRLTGLQVAALASLTAGGRFSLNYTKGPSVEGYLNQPGGNVRVRILPDGSVVRVIDPAVAPVAVVPVAPPPGVRAVPPRPTLGRPEALMMFGIELFGVVLALILIGGSIGLLAEADWPWRVLPLWAATAIAFAVVATIAGGWLQLYVLPRLAGRFLGDPTAILAAAILRLLVGCVPPVAVLAVLASDAARAWRIQRGGRAIGPPDYSGLIRAGLWVSGAMGAGMLIWYGLVLVLPSGLVRDVAGSAAEQVGGLAFALVLLAIPLEARRRSAWSASPAVVGAIAAAVLFAGFGRGSPADAAAPDSTYARLQTETARGLAETVRNNPQERTAAAAQLVRMGRHALPFIYQLVADKDPQVGKAILEALHSTRAWVGGPLGEPARRAAEAAIPTLIDLADCQKSGDEESAIRLLAPIGEPAADALYEAVRDKRVILCRPGAEEHGLLMTGALHDPRPDVRARACIDCAGPGSAQRLFELTGDKEPAVRRAAARAIVRRLRYNDTEGDIDLQEGMRVLAPFEGDPDRVVRQDLDNARRRAAPVLPWFPQPVSTQPLAAEAEAEAKPPSGAAAAAGALTTNPVPATGTRATSVGAASPFPASDTSVIHGVLSVAGWVVRILQVIALGVGIGWIAFEKVFRRAACPQPG